MKFPKFLFIYSLLIGCSTVKEGPHHLNESMTIKHYVESYGEVSTPALNQSLKNLVLNLVVTLHEKVPPPKVVILNTSEVFALSFGKQYIALSKGLFCALRSDNQLAFIIAHELAHQIFHQHSNQADDVHHRELEADEIALNMITRAGFDPTEALRVFSLPALYVWMEIESSYPTIQERVHHGYTVNKTLKTKIHGISPRSLDFNRINTVICP